MLIDTHTHLYLITNDDIEINNIIDRCKKEQINHLFNISVDYKSNFSSQKLSKIYNEIYYSVGLHPQEADNYTQDQIDDIEKLLLDDKCIGIGEIGIDLYRDYSRVNNQIELFELFLSKAKKYNKPVIIHSREAFKEVFNLVNKAEYKDVTGVFHCYSYGYEEAKKCIDMGYSISFAGNLTYKNANNLQDTAKKVPLEFILCETDSPFLSPVPFRGKKNYPYHITHIIKFLSNIKGMPMNKVIDQIYNNIRELFKI